MNKEKVKWVKLMKQWSGKQNKVYYFLFYCELNGETHQGYASFDKEQVEKWLEECFEIVE